MYALKGYENGNAHASSSSKGMSSTVFQAFILSFERSREGAEIFPWLAVCFLGRRGMVGVDGLVPQGKFSYGANVCLALFGKDFRPTGSARSCSEQRSPHFLPLSRQDKRADVRVAAGITMRRNFI